ncbi:MAG: tetratricopeptide repeat protein [Saprospiraceae bacterium]
MPHIQKNLFHWPIAFVCGFACLIPPGCKEAPQTENLSAAADTKALLLAADSLPEAEVFARAARLPAVQQDSFFTQRLAHLEATENLPAMEKTAAAYLAARPGHPAAQWEVAYYQGVIFQYAGKFDSANIAYARAAEGLEQLDAKSQLAQTLDSWSGNLNTQGKYDEALAMKYRALDIAQTLNQPEWVMHIRAHLANVYNAKGDYNKAIDILDELLVFAEAQKDTAYIAYVLSTKGNSLIHKRDWENALKTHGRALALRHQRPTANLPESQFSYARILGKMGRWAEALDTLRAADANIRKHSNKQGLSLVASFTGEALFQLGQYQEAEKYLLSGLEMSLARNQYPAAAAGARILSLTKKKRGDFAEALRYHEQYMTLKDSSFNQEKDKITRELSVKYETREKEQQIAALHREHRLAAQRNWWIVGALSVLTLSVLVFIQQRARRRQERLEKTLELQRLELQAHQTRLADYAQMLVERNTRIAEMSQTFSEPQPAPSNESAPNTERVAAAEQLYNQRIITEEDWEQFQQRFNKVYPGFLAEARSQFPGLTAGEMRQLMLDKMGLSLKECAAILGIGVASVKQGRYRLRKKLQAEGSDIADLLPDDSTEAKPAGIKI